MYDPDLHTWDTDTARLERDREIDADDCPEWGGDHRYEEQETWDHHIVIGCNCGHQPPPEREEL